MMAKTTRKPKLTAEQIAFRDGRAVQLDKVERAIRDGRAYLATSIGRRKVVAYHDSTGNAVTNNTGRSEDDRTFMVCLDQILID